VEFHSGPRYLCGWLCNHPVEAMKALQQALNGCRPLDQVAIFILPHFGWGRLESSLQVDLLLLPNPQPFGFISSCRYHVYCSALSLEQYTMAAPACYWKTLGQVQSSTDWETFTSPCGPVNNTNPVVPCCVNGDYCMSDGFCHYTHSEEGGSGYYSASCTDPTYESHVCQNRCGKKAVPQYVRSL
jgi:hypothetical protein